VGHGGDARVRRRIFQALPRCVSAVSKEPHAYRQLLDALFKADLLGDAAETDDYAAFLVHLVSSNTVYVVPTLQMLVRNLCRPQPQQLPPALQAALGQASSIAVATAAAAATPKIAVGGSFGAAAQPTKQAEQAPAIDVEQCIQQRFERAHETLQRVLALAPTAANILFPMVCEHFPHKRLDAPFQVAYLRNMLRLSTYAPGLRERIFALVVDQLVAIDVEIKLDESEEDVFTMDDFLDDDLLPDTTGENVDEMADKLDQMMVIMFEHIEATTRSPDAGGEGEAKDEDATDVHRAALIFKYLLKVFEHSILNTHRSKYPQFLLFYVCKMDPQFQDVFISQLLASSLDPQTPPVMRQSCGAYLASFLARAKYISVAYLQKALYHLLKWLHDQMDVYDALAAAGSGADGDGDKPLALATQEAALEKEGEGGDKPAYFQEGIYVSTLQTVCYLLCFRGLEIAQSESGYDFLRSLGWERLLITSASSASSALGYCPLAFCQPTVSAEFLNFVETLDLISEDCIDRVDQAMSASSATASSSTRAGRGKSMERSATPSASGWQATTAGLGQRQPLETFFPFDPYLLRRSFRFIGPLYLYWKHADPTSGENIEALNTVKGIIRSLYEHESDDDDADDDNRSDREEEEEDVSMAGSAPASSFKNSSFMSSRPSSYMSVSSSLDGDYGYGGRGEDDDGDDDDDDDENGELLLKPSGHRKQKRVVPPRNTFDPSPALSSSSPPSRLPPLGTTNAFALGGFDDDEDDTGF
jgi:RNA polymerase I-specific transcription initiation factor RRN3